MTYRRLHAVRRAFLVCLSAISLCLWRSSAAEPSFRQAFRRARSQPGSWDADVIVCSGALVADSVDNWKTLRDNGCHIIYGSLYVLNLTDFDTKLGRADYGMTSLRHITGTLVVGDVHVPELRTLFPDLVAVHGNVQAGHVTSLLSTNSSRWLSVIKSALGDSISVVISMNPTLKSAGLQGISVLKGYTVFSVSHEIYTESTISSSDVRQVGNSPCHIAYDGNLWCPMGTDLACNWAVNTTYQTVIKSNTSTSCLYYGHDLQTCTAKCPPGYYLFEQHLCLHSGCPKVLDVATNDTTHQFFAQQVSFTLNSTSSQRTDNSVPQCRLNCLSGFQENTSTLACDNCSQPNIHCKKECEGGAVFTLSQLCRFMGCTHIIGNLYVFIDKPINIPNCFPEEDSVWSIMDALQKAFGQVEHISGYALFIQVTCLTSTRFLKNLREVGSNRPSGYTGPLLIFYMNRELTSLDGLENLQKIGNTELKSWRTINDVVKVVSITNNPQLCSSLIVDFFAKKSASQQAFMLDLAANRPTSGRTADVFSTNGLGGKLCGPYFSLHARQIDTTTIEIAWSPRAGPFTVDIYLFYASTKSGSSSFRRSVLTDVNGTFQCLARLEEWTSVSISPKVAAYNLTRLPVCSEYAFQLGTSGYLPGTGKGIIPLGYSTITVMGPLPPEVLPAPTSVFTLTNTKNDIIIRWSPPNLRCDHDLPVTYRVYWQKIQLMTPVSRGVSLDNCGAACSCAFGDQLTADTESSSTCRSFLVHLSADNTSISVGYGVQNEHRDRRAELLNQVFRLSNIPICGFSSSASNATLGCCRNGVAIRLGQVSFNDTGILNNAQEATTTSSNFTIPRSDLEDFSIYAIAVQAVHGAAGESDNVWGVLAITNLPATRNTVGDFGGARQANGTMCLTWKAPSNPSAPVLGYDLLMTSLPRSDASEDLNTDFNKCLQGHCARLIGAHNCINISFSSKLNHSISYPVGVLAVLASPRINSLSRQSQFCFPSNECPLPNGPTPELNIEIRTITLAGCGPWSDCYTFYVAQPQSSTSSNVTTEIALATSICAVFIICIIVILILVKSRRKSRQEAEEVRLLLNKFQSQPNQLGVRRMTEGCKLTHSCSDILWEIPLERVTILEELGHGNYGKVFRGKVKRYNCKLEGDEEIDVAIKTLHHDASIEDRESFIDEACVMKTLNSPHLIQLVGIVSQEDTLVIMEYMACGDLKQYLRAVRPERQREDGFDKVVPSSTRFEEWAKELASAMEYLEKQKFIHRDLAARNCMLDSYLKLHLGDFGLARDIYTSDYYRRGEKRTALPLRWLSPESVQDGVFSMASDVWSYGIVLWEMATLARQPYPGRSNEDVIKLLLKGGHPEVPTPILDFPETVLQIMPRCWAPNPNHRPSFEDLTRTFTGYNVLESPT